MKYISTKTYPSIGSTVFRQWRANSHCNLFHGYSLTVYVEFEADTLDARNWVMDFGGLKSLKEYLDDLLDHTWVVAEDDPHYTDIVAFAHKGLCDIRFVKATGCEGIASHIMDWIERHILAKQDRVRCRKVEVREHERNSAMVES